MTRLLLLLLVTTQAHALVLISESRSVYANYWGGGDRSELITSAGTFGTFNATARGIPFGGGFVNASQNSTITPDGFDLRHSVLDMYGPGGEARSSFSFTFGLTVPSRVTLTGYSNYFSGIASFSGGGLVWAGPNGVKDIYNNYLNFDQVLGPGQYTFTSQEMLRFDNPVSTYSLRAQGVPDGESIMESIVLALLVIIIVARRIQ